MKKSLLLLSAVVFGLSASAQITITTSDVANPTKLIFQATDTTVVSPSLIGSAGISQTWNMTSLQEGRLDTLTFISYAWVPNPSFSSSNLVAQQGTTSNYIYLINNATGLFALGSAGTQDFGMGPVSVKQINSPAEKLMTFPGNYLTTFTNNYTTTTPPFYFGIDPGIGVPIDSIRQHSDVKKNVLVDAWGSLSTPLGTFNVLRNKETVVRYDTTDVFVSALGGWNDAIITAADSTTGYSWWANMVGFPLVSMKLDSLGAIKQCEWLKALPLTGVEEYTNVTEANVYPNPAQNQVTMAIDAKLVGSIQIFDITGRMINLINVEGASQVSINTTDYASGVYTYALIGNDQAILNRGKFTIAK